MAQKVRSQASEMSKDGDRYAIRIGSARAAVVAKAAANATDAVAAISNRRLNMS